MVKRSRPPLYSVDEDPTDFAGTLPIFSSAREGTGTRQSPLSSVVTGAMAAGGRALNSATDIDRLVLSSSRKGFLTRSSEVLYV